jgi:2-polyprenyl-3-methyl-5-hydroxy-6-metoxy-1,4-benzoquinol methylase
VSLNDVRAYWDARPCNLKHSDAPMGTRQYFDEVRQRKYFVEPHIPDFADFERWHGKLILEVGCGIGTAAVDFALAGAQVTAVELSPGSLEIARQQAHAYGADIEFVEANAETLTSTFGIMPTRYDLIYSFGVLHHTPNPEQALQQLHHFVHKNTELRIMLYHRHSFKALSLALHGGIRRQSEAQPDCPVTYVYSRQEAVGLLRRTGWRIANMSVEHIFPYQIAAYRRHEYRIAWPMAAAWWHKPTWRWLEQRFGWHLLIEATPEW